MEEIEYLGCIINSEGVKAKINKDKIMNLTPPKTKKQLKKLTGFINWYRPYVKNLSEKPAYLHEKEKGNKRIIEWNDEDSKKLENIKNDLMNITI